MQVPGGLECVTTEANQVDKRISLDYRYLIRRRNDPCQGLQTRLGFNPR